MTIAALLPSHLRDLVARTNDALAERSKDRATYCRIMATDSAFLLAAIGGNAAAVGALTEAADLIRKLDTELASSATVAKLSDGD